ncbi:M20 family metallopeptidase [Erwinia sp. BNK-24-b]|uniref:M20 family metallopeptidase n=1 Tax=unclassified Erwinia TaxID=2622719 RepID=UPI0039BFD459
MSINEVLTRADAWFDSGEFKQILARRIAIRSESQRDDRESEIQRYLHEEIAPAMQALGFALTEIANPQAPLRPFLLATRIENSALPTLLCYGHGDVVFGDDENWRAGLDPWQLREEGDRWYGRGSADNKGQHAVNIAALEQIFAARGGSLGFNCKFLFEMGEEIGSPGLAQICRENPQLLGADIFIASDGPRLSAEQPTLFLGSRGAVNVRLSIEARDRDYHSGNWGGLLSNPGTQLANAVASLVNQHGQLQVSALKPPALTEEVRTILGEIVLPPDATGPQIDAEWGEAGLTPVERLYGWNTLEVLSFLTGNPARPMNAIPGSATAVCQLRFVPGTDWENIADHLTAHLGERGFHQVKVEMLRGTPATRLDPGNPLVGWALEAMQQASEKKPALLPNLGGSLPNDVFAHILNLPTLWVPHSYPACGQHAADEHLLISIAREGLQIMTRLLWELGEKGSELLASHRHYQQQKGARP